MKRLYLLTLLMTLSFSGFGQTKILMPEINEVTFFKSNDKDLKLDSMMRAHNYKAFDRDGARPKEVTYYADNGDMFISGYDTERKVLSVVFVLNDAKQFYAINNQVSKTFPKIGKGDYEGFNTELYNVGYGIGTIEVGFSKENKFIVNRVFPIPNYYWNVENYQ